MLRLFVLLCAAALVALAGCAGSARPAAADGSAGRWVDAVEAGDTEGAVAVSQATIKAAGVAFHDAFGYDLAPFDEPLNYYDVPTARVTLGRRPGDGEISQNGGQRVRPDRQREPARAPARAEVLGMTLQTITPQVARQIGIDAQEGVAVVDVDRSSEAFRDAGIQRGAVIVEVERRPVTSVEEFQAAVAGVQRGETFLVRVQFGPSSFLTALTKE